MDVLDEIQSRWIKPEVNLEDYPRKSVISSLFEDFSKGKDLCGVGNCNVVASDII